MPAARHPVKRGVGVAIPTFMLFLDCALTTGITIKIKLNPSCHSIDAPRSKNGSHVQLFFSIVQTVLQVRKRLYRERVEVARVGSECLTLKWSLVLACIQWRSANFHTTETRFFSILTSQGPDREDGTNIESLLRTCDAAERASRRF